uniref:Ion transport domain-containing protein n=1 Tax=Chromera velia CCMP2878 TaxID=1169474 RepID=A0A0G4I3I2_9ALVE|eukprot:Cvel_10680.t1-p1 / transcript=Cvel_10680.t1 / gene=Cvel_10680 / organism=Chromera_velia_CCMP2878 / gene_product=hypothetical protein / transcript_product=hypothetical protein / location=Cvel_scaffold649:24735-36742(-) / protein_length=1492 / sequence_SO=supercontig / SO=protein_coding / is_pseudo=false
MPTRDPVSKFSPGVPTEGATTRRVPYRQMNSFGAGGTTDGSEPGGAKAPILPDYEYPPPFNSHLWTEFDFALHEEVSELLNHEKTPMNSQPPTFLSLEGHSREDPAHTINWSPSGSLLSSISSGGKDGQSGKLVVHDRKTVDGVSLPVVSTFQPEPEIVRGKKCPTRLHVMDWARPRDQYIAVAGVVVYSKVIALCRVFVVEAATGRLVWRFGGGPESVEASELVIEQHLSFSFNSSKLCFALGAPRGLPGKILTFSLDSASFAEKGQEAPFAVADSVWLLGNDDDISRVRWGPIGEHEEKLAVAVITRKREGRLYVMEPASGVISLMVNVISSPIKCFCLAAFGLRVLTGHFDGTVRCFGSFSGQELANFTSVSLSLLQSFLLREKGVSCANFHQSETMPRGVALVVIGAHTPMASMRACDWTSDDAYIVTMSRAEQEKNKICVWPSTAFETPAFENRFHPDETGEAAILRTAVSPLGDYLACAQRGGWLAVTRMGSPSDSVTSPGGSGSSTKFYRVDEQTSQNCDVRLSGESVVHMISADTCKLLWVVGSAVALELIRDQNFTPDGSLLAVAHGAVDRPEVTVLSSSDGSISWRLSERMMGEGPTQMITCVRFSPDGSSLAVAGAGQEVPEQRLAFEISSAEDEDNVAEDPNLFVYDLTSGAVLSKHAHGIILHSLDWHPNGRTLACGGGGVAGVVLVDAFKTARTVLRLAQYGQQCMALSFSASGRLLGCGFNNDEVCVIYDLETCRMSDFFPGRGPIIFSPDGNALLYGGKVEKWVHARLMAHVKPVWSLTKSVLGFIRCKSAVQKFPLDEVLRFAHHRLFAGRGPKGGSLIHIAMAGLKDKRSAFTVADVHAIIEANPIACLFAIGRMTHDIGEPQTPLMMAIERGWQSIYMKMFEAISNVDINPSQVGIPPYSHKMLEIQRKGIQLTAASLIRNFGTQRKVAQVCLALLMSDPPGQLRGVPKGSEDWAMTTSNKASLTPSVWKALVDEHELDAKMQPEPVNSALPPYESQYEKNVASAVCKPHIFEKDLWAGQEYVLRAISFPATSLQEAIMSSREEQFVFHPLFKATVKFKWEQYGRAFALIETFLVCLYLAAYIGWGSTLLGCPPSVPLEGHVVDAERTGVLCHSDGKGGTDLDVLLFTYTTTWTATLAMTIFFAAKELSEISLAYLTDAFNWVDMLSLFCTGAILIADGYLRFRGLAEKKEDEATAQAPWPVIYLTSLALLMHFIRLNEKYRAFRVFGTYVKALLQIFSDMGGFLFLLFTLNCAFAIVFFWLFNTQTAESDRDQIEGMELDLSFLKAFSLGVLGEDLSFADLAAFPRFVLVMVIILWLIINIVMLNSLIALVSESWANITGSRDLNSLIERGVILNNIDRFWRRAKKEPAILFIAERGERDLLAPFQSREEAEEQARDSLRQALTEDMKELVFRAFDERDRERKGEAVRRASLMSAAEILASRVAPKAETPNAGVSPETVRVEVEKGKGKGPS